MNRVTLGCVSLLLAWMSAGCGTVANMKGGYVLGPQLAGYPAPYGGVVLDIGRLTASDDEFTTPFVSVFGRLFLLADLPLTVVGDTVTLPWMLNQSDHGLWYSREPSIVFVGEDPTPPAAPEARTRTRIVLAPVPPPNRDKGGP